MRRFISFGIYSWAGDDFGEVPNLVVIWTQRTPVYLLYSHKIGQNLHQQALSPLYVQFSGHPEKFRQIFESFEHVRQKLVAIWSTSEKSAKLSYIVCNLDWFWKTIRWLIGPARELPHTFPSLRKFNTQRTPVTPLCPSFTGPPLIRQVSAERAYWYLKEETFTLLSRVIFEKITPRCSIICTGDSCHVLSFLCSKMTFGTLYRHSFPRWMG